MPQPLRILPFGDSLTVFDCRLNAYTTADDRPIFWSLNETPAISLYPKGTFFITAQGGYRGHLARLLKAPAPPWSYVGSQYGCGSHEGYAGETIEWLSENVATNAMRNAQPDVVLFLGGTNDFFWPPPRGSRSPTEVLDRLRGLLNRTFAVVPNVTFLLSTITPINETRCATYHTARWQPGDCPTDMQANIAAYNAKLPEVTAEYRRHGFTIEVVQQPSRAAVGQRSCDERTFCDEDYWIWGIHFNTTGFEKMAAAWHRSLIQTDVFRRHATRTRPTESVQLGGELKGSRRAVSGAVPLTTSTGQRRLASQPEGAPVWRLLPSLETQVTQTFCSVATAATLLNSLPGVVRPVGKFYAPHAYFTQYNVLGPCAAERPSQPRRGTSTAPSPGNLTAAWVTTHGATAPDQASFIGCFADATAVHAADSSIDEFRAAARDLERGGVLLAANFARGALGQEGGGHFSPLAAYDETSDSVLILDVARYKYPSFWFPLLDIFNAMNTTDMSTGLSRGWVSVQAHSPGRAPPLPPAPAPAPPPDFAKIAACIETLEPTDAPHIITCFAEPN